MRTLCWFLLAAALIGSTGEAAAQRRRNSDSSRQAFPERVERFRKMRLIETLKLGEEASIRFFAKQSAHEEKVRALMQSRDAALDGLEKQLGDGKRNDHELQRQADQLMDLDAQVFAERQRFQGEIREMLTAEQFSRFMLFERDFGRQVRGALQEMRGQRPRRDRED